MHVDASYIDLGVVLVQPRVGDIDHHIEFSSRKLSKVKKNYSMSEREGLARVYALQKFRHYLLGAHFKMFKDYSTLKYLVIKAILGGKIYRCLLLFQGYYFEVIVKLGRLNARLDHLSKIET